MTKIYCRDAEAALCVFDLTDRNSLDRCAEWKAKISENLNTDAIIPYLLVGNKCDLENSISDEMLNSFAEEHGFIRGVKASAKTGDNS